MKKRLIVFALASAAGMVTAAGQEPAQQPQQPPITFRAETNYVEVDTRVLDRDGKFVATLKADDFQVFEDGKPQKVSAFSLVNIPLSISSHHLSWSEEAIKRWILSCLFLVLLALSGLGAPPCLSFRNDCSLLIICLLLVIY